MYLISSHKCCEPDGKLIITAFLAIIRQVTKKKYIPRHALARVIQVGFYVAVVWLRQLLSKRMNVTKIITVLQSVASVYK